MWLILIFVIIFSASLIGYLVCNQRYKHYDAIANKQHNIQFAYSCNAPEYKEAEAKEKAARSKMNRLSHWDIPLFAVMVCGIVALLVCCLVMINQCTALQDRIDLEETYAALCEAEMGVMPHDCSISEMRVKYNTTIRNNQRWNDSIWIGWFIPDFYDEMPLFHSPAT